MPWNQEARSRCKDYYKHINQLLIELCTWMADEEGSSGLFHCIYSCTLSFHPNLKNEMLLRNSQPLFSRVKFSWLGKKFPDPPSNIEFHHEMLEYQGEEYLLMIICKNGGQIFVCFWSRKILKWCIHLYLYLHCAGQSSIEYPSPWRHKKDMCVLAFYRVWLLVNA